MDREELRLIGTKSQDIEAIRKFKEIVDNEGYSSLGLFKKLIKNNINPSFKLYVDSDGVLANLQDWVYTINSNLDIDRNKPENKKNAKSLYKLMVENYKDCFLKSTIIEKNSYLLNYLRLYNNCFVLTATLNYNTIKQFTKDDPDKIFNTLKENKYKWYENLGITREKVIIVDDANDKVKYVSNNSILIDDYKNNIENWIKFGGIGIKV